MKLYTSEKHQFGKELQIANEIIKFDKLGIAEVSEEVGEKVISYSKWYSDKPFDFSKELKEAEIKNENKVENEGVIAELKLQIQDYKKLNEERVSEINRLKTELADIVKTLGNEVELRKSFEEKLQNFEKQAEKNLEVQEFRLKLSEQTLEELKETCAKLEIEEEKYIRLRKEEKIVEVIMEHVYGNANN
jgi:hypothetical protein